MADETKGRYQQLVDTVAGLQKDLQQAVDSCRTMRIEKERIVEDYEEVKEECLRAKNKIVQLNKHIVEATESKVEADRYTEDLISKWKEQLDSRTKELEMLQTKIVPQDMDLLRIQIQEELEV